MKVIIIGTAYPMRGGMSDFNTHLYRYLSELHPCKIFSFKKQYPEFLFPGKTQFETGKPLISVPEKSNIITINSINPFNWLITGLKVRKEKADLLIYQYWIPFFAPCFFVISFVAKIFRKTKVLFICHNIIPHEKRFGDVILTKFVLRIVDFFIVLSKSVLHELSELKIDKPQIMSPHPIYNLFGISEDKSSAIEYLAQNYSLKIADEKIILFFGLIRKYKGLNILLKALSLVLKEFDIKLLIAGEFYEDSALYLKEIEENKLKDRILLVDYFIPSEDVKYFFSASDCLILPYLDASQSGIAQIAYNFEKPIIASRVGGLSEFVLDGETGFLVSPDNPEELANAIIKFYKEKKENDFSERTKKEAKKYSWSYFIQNIENLVNNNVKEDNAE